MNQSSDEASETIGLVDWTIGQTEKRKRTGEIAHLEKAEVVQKSESRTEEKIDIGGIVDPLVYSYEDRGLASDVKALKAVEIISMNYCVMSCCEQLPGQSTKQPVLGCLESGIQRQYTLTT